MVSRWGVRADVTSEFAAQPAGRGAPGSARALLTGSPSWTGTLDPCANPRDLGLLDGAS